jgi:predicted AAA+ superfamily ATPase
MTRYLTPFIQDDLKEKMVFLSGPRQVGKTTLALSFLKGNSKHPA